MYRTLARYLSVLAVACTATGAAVSAHAAFPDKPITFIVPSAAGGSPDVLSRLITTQIAKDTGATLVIENRPGAAGNIGVSLIKRAEADGYTIGYGNINTLAVNRSLFMVEAGRGGAAGTGHGGVAADGMIVRVR